MRILDRYIIRQYLINYVILFFVLMSLFVMIDLMVDLDEFIKAGQARSQEFGGQIPATLAVVADFYGPLVLLAYVYFSGVLAVGAIGFTFAGLSRNGEMVAMVTGGLSMHRVAAPVLVVGCVLCLLVLPDQEYLIPDLAPKLVRNKAQVKFETLQGFPVRYSPDGHFNLFSAARFDASAHELSDLTILVRNPQGQAMQRITAAKGNWDDARQGWNLEGGLALNRSQDDDSGAARVWAGSQPISFFSSDLSPKVLLARRARFYPRFLPLSELERLRDNPALEASQQRKISQIMHSRFSLIVTAVLIQVMALPFFLLREPASLLAQSVKAAGLCLGAWGLATLLVEANLPGLSPATTAWLPVVVLLPISAAMLQTVRT